MVVYQIDHTSKLSLAAALNPNQAASGDLFRADVIQKTRAWRALFRVPVMTSCSSCLVQTFTRIIALAPLFCFLSVVGRRAAWEGVWGGVGVGESVFTVYLLHAWTV